MKQLKTCGFELSCTICASTSSVFTPVEIISSNYTVVDMLFLKNIDYNLKFKLKLDTDKLKGLSSKDLFLLI